MSAPAVSVVVGVHNGGEALRPSLDSVLRQQGPSLELIVVDDGSTDATPQVLARLHSADARVRPLFLRRGGLTAALVAGCAVARGEFVARHDGDDCSLPGRLARQAALLREDPGLSFVSCWCRALGPQGEWLWSASPCGERATATRLLHEQRAGPPHHGSVMFRRTAYEQVGGYRPQFYCAQDSDLWLRLAEIGDYALVPELLYEFRVSESGISARHSRTQARLGELSHACRAARAAGRPEAPLLAAAAALRPSADAAEDARAGAYFIGRCLLARDDPRARRYLLRALRGRPWSPRCWLSLAQLWLRQARRGRTPASVGDAKGR